MARFTVTTTSDDAFDGNGNDATDGGGLSLREAIGLANANADFDIIDFDPTVFTGGADSVIRLGEEGELLIRESVSIDGSTGTQVVVTGDSEGNDTLIDGTFISVLDENSRTDEGALEDNSRVFVIDRDNLNVGFNALTITGGNALSAGGGIDAGQVLDTNLVVTNSTIAGNAAGASGGGVSATLGTGTFINTTIANNFAITSGGGVIGSGNSDLTFINTTVAGNLALGTGGGVNLQAQSALTSVNSVIAGNVSVEGIDDLVDLDGSSTISATSSFIDGPVIIDQNNGGNILNVGDAGLEGVSTNGGVGGAVLVTAGSPLVNAGNSTATFAALDETALGFDINGDGDALDTAIDSVDDLLIDGRGGERNQNGVDIGAAEFQFIPARTLTVTSASDEGDDATVTGDFLQEAGDGDGLSLREALFFANAFEDFTNIDFDASVFTGGAESVIRLGEAGTFNITESVAIDGSTATGVLITGDVAGNDVLVDGTFITDVVTVITNENQDNKRVFDVAFSAENVTFNGLTITGGDVTNVDAISNLGGGILSETESLTVSNSTIAGNRALVGGGVSQSGGDATFVNTTISNNFATGVGGGLDADILATGGTFTLIQSTVANNVASGTGGTARDGGVAVGGLATLNSVNSVFAGNAADTGGQDISLPGIGSGIVNLTSSFVGDNFTPNQDNGGNIIGGGAAGNGPIGDNGGDVLTTVVVLDSPLIDAGNSTATFAALDETVIGVDLNGDGDALDTAIDSIDDLLVDARGGARNLNGVDIGATEIQETPTVLTVTTNSDDGVDAAITGDLIVEQGDGGGLSLREALLLANENPDFNRIEFDDSVFTGGAESVIRLGETGSLEIFQSVAIDGATAQDLVITGDVNGDDTLRDGTFITDVAAAGSGATRGDNPIVLRIDNAAENVALNGLTITGGNAGNAAGGGILTNADNLTVTNSLIAGNFSGLQGGGVAVGAFDTATFLNSTIANNASTVLGGGFFTNPFANLNLIQSTVTENSSGVTGGGATVLLNTTLTSVNSVIAGNTSTAGGSDIDELLDNTINATSTFFGSNDVVIDQDNGGNTLGGGNTGLIDLGDHGGTIATFDVSADSPLINAGNDTAGFAALDETVIGLDINGDGDVLDTAIDSIDDLLVDARGGARNVNGVDIGATEAESATCSNTPDEVELVELNGTDDSDFLKGTDAAEAIRGLGGRYDRLLGGEGADQFIFGAETSNGIRERDLILDYEVGVDEIVLEEGASIGSIRETSSHVVIFLEDDRDAIYIRGDDVTADNISIVTSDILELA